MIDETQIAASVQRLMRQVDYYLHCELDVEYEHDRPERARVRLEQALQEELKQSLMQSTH